MKQFKRAFSRAQYRADPIGRALHLYWHILQTNRTAQGHIAQYNIEVEADLLERDILPVDYLFRTVSKMPALEHKALNACKGKVLDVGAAAGCHAHELQARGFNVVAIDTSAGAVEVLKKRGLQAKKIDFLSLKPESAQFDTILLLMNGLGIASNYELLPQFFQQLSALLQDNGQVLVDSSDFGADAQSFACIRYRLHFQGEKSKWFSWLFLPFSKLLESATIYGFNAALLHQENDGSYLAQLTKKR